MVDTNRMAAIDKARTGVQSPPVTDTVPLRVRLVNSAALMPSVAFTLVPLKATVVTGSAG